MKTKTEMDLLNRIKEVNTRTPEIVLGEGSATKVRHYINCIITNYRKSCDIRDKMLDSVRDITIKQLVFSNTPKNYQITNLEKITNTITEECDNSLFVNCWALSDMVHKEFEELNLGRTLEGSLFLEIFQKLFKVLGDQDEAIEKEFTETLFKTLMYYIPDGETRSDIEELNYINYVRNIILRKISEVTNTKNETLKFHLDSCVFFDHSSRGTFEKRWMVRNRANRFGCELFGLDKEGFEQMFNDVFVSKYTYDTFDTSEHSPNVKAIKFFQNGSVKVWFKDKPTKTAFYQRFRFDLQGNTDKVMDETYFYDIKLSDIK